MPRDLLAQPKPRDLLADSQPRDLLGDDRRADDVSRETPQPQNRSQTPPQPQPTQPKPSQPKPSQPQPTQPKPSQPKPSQPQPSQPQNRPQKTPQPSQPQPTRTPAQPTTATQQPQTATTDPEDARRAQSRQKLDAMLAERGITSPAAVQAARQTFESAEPAFGRMARAAAANRPTPQADAGPKTPRESPDDGQSLIGRGLDVLGEGARGALGGTGAAMRGIASLAPDDESEVVVEYDSLQEAMQADHSPDAVIEPMEGGGVRVVEPVAAPSMMAGMGDLLDEAGRKLESAAASIAQPEHPGGVPETIGAAIGSTAPFFLPGGVAGRGARALTTGRGLVQRGGRLVRQSGGRAVTGVGMHLRSADESTERAREQGQDVSDRDADLRRLAAVPLGLSELAPVERILGPLRRVAPQFVRRAERSVLRRAAESGGRISGAAAAEAAQEVGANTSESELNHILLGLERDPQLREAILAGSGAGAFFAAIVELAARRRGMTDTLSRIADQESTRTQETTDTGMTADEAAEAIRTRPGAQPQETADALQEQESARVPAREQAEAGPQVGQEVRREGQARPEARQEVGERQARRGFREGVERAELPSERGSLRPEDVFRRDDIPDATEARLRELGWTEQELANATDEQIQRAIDEGLTPEQARQTAPAAEAAQQPLQAEQKQVTPESAPPMAGQPQAQEGAVSQKAATPPTETRPEQETPGAAQLEQPPSEPATPPTETWPAQETTEGAADQADYASAAQRIDDAMEDMRGFMADDDASLAIDSQGFTQEEKYKSAIESELTAIAQRHNVEVERVSDGQSTYWELTARDADGDEIDSVRVRASNHPQRHSGPIWSFELTDDAASIAKGLREIDSAVTDLARQSAQPAQPPPEPATPETGADVSPQAARTAEDAGEGGGLVDKLDRIENEARERIRNRKLPGEGREKGGTTLGRDLTDAAVMAFARAGKAGVRTLKGIEQIVDRVVSEMGLTIDASQSRRVARKVRAMQKRQDEGENVDTLIDDTVARSERAEGRTIKAQVAEETGAGRKRREEPSVKETDALRAGMKAQRRVGRLADKAARDDVKSTVREVVEELERTLPPEQQKKFNKAIANARTKEQLQERIDRVREQVLWNRARKTLEQTVESLKLGPRQRGKQLRPEYQEQVGDVLGDIDLKRMSASTERRLESRARFLARNADLHDVPESAINDLKRLKARATGEGIEQMTAGEIESVTEAIQMAEHLSDTHNRLLANQEQRRHDEAVRDISSEVSQAPPLPEEKQSRKVANRIRRKLRMPEQATSTDRSNLRRYLSWSAPFSQLVEEISDTMSRTIYTPLRRASSAHRAFGQRTHDLMQDVFSQHDMGFGQIKTERWRRERVNIETRQGPRQITRGERIWLAVQAKAPDNYGRAMRDGISLGRLGPSFRDISMTPDQVDRSLEQMDDAERAIADFMFDQFNGRAKKTINDATVDVFGVAKADVPMYAPVTVDPLAMQRDVGSDTLMGTYGEKSLESWKRLIQRRGSRSPLEIDDAFDQFFTHMDMAGRIGAFLRAERDARRILGDPAVKQAIVSRYGDSMLKYLDRHVRRAAVGISRAGGRPNALMRGLIRLRSTGTLFWRLSTVGLQPASLFLSMPYFDKPTRIMEALPSSGWDAMETRRIDALASKHSPMWRDRFDSFFDTMTSGVLRDTSTINLGESANEMLSKIGFMPIRLMDMHLSALRWRAAENQVRDTRPDLEDGSDAFYAEVADLWENVLLSTDSTSDEVNMSDAIAQGKEHPWFGLFTVFQSAPSKIYGTMRKAAMHARRGEHKMATVSAIGVLLQTAWVVGVRQVDEWLERDDEDEDRPPRTVTGDAFREAVGVLPVFGDVVSAASRSVETAGRENWSAGDTFVNDLITTSTRTANGVLQTAVAGLEDEHTAAGESAAREKMWNTLGSAVRLLDNVGLPGSSMQDWRDKGQAMYKRFAGPTEQSVLNDAFEGEDERETTSALRDMRAALLSDDPKLFKRAYERYAGHESLSRTQLVNRVVRARFRRWNQIANSAEKMARLDEQGREIVAQKMREQRELEHALEAMLSRL